MKIIKTGFLLLASAMCLLGSGTLYSQTGESKFKMIVINQNERKVAPLYPSFKLTGLGFKDADMNSELNGKENGTINFYLKNTGTVPLEELTITLKTEDNANIPGLTYPASRSIKSIGLGDSALVTMDLATDEKLKDGFAKFEIIVKDARSDSTDIAKLEIPTKEFLTPPEFRWLTPASPTEMSEFSVSDISGVIKSKSKITSVKIYVNNQEPEDNRSFEYLSGENPNEYVVKRSIFLNEGDNEIKIEATNAQGVTTSETRTLNYFVQKIDANYVEIRLALVIGNANYVGINALQNSVNDAKAIATALKSVNFKVIMALNADRKGMIKAMDDFGDQLTDYTVGLFYYAGHGMQVKGDNYFIPVDANPKIERDVESDCISANRLLGKMEAARTTTNIIILDACRDNPFSRSWSTSRSSAQEGGLAFMDAPSGTIIAYATAPGKTASDGSGKNGLYTEALLKFINVPKLSLLDFFQNVRTEVEKKSNGAQTPWESTSLKGYFYFKLN